VGQDFPIKYAIAIPAKDEEHQIRRCLHALNTQAEDLLKNVNVLLLVNNSADGTAATAHSLAPDLLYRLDVCEINLPGGEANAGKARRLAMDAAYLSLADKAGGVLLTTDADSTVASNWLEKNLSALRNADAVAGDVEYVLDVHSPADPVCTTKRLEATYDTILAEIEAILDPVRHNPWPRHRTESGASLAMWGLTYLRVGGLPLSAAGEDRAICAQVEAHGLSLRHEPEVKVKTSVRLDGRAAGGAADFLRHRHRNGDNRCGREMISVDRTASMARLKNWTRNAFVERRVNAGYLERMLKLPQGLGVEVFSARTFGAAWQIVQQQSTRLIAEPLTLRELPSQIHQGKALIRYLRRCQDLQQCFGEGRADSLASSPAPSTSSRLQAAE
jgi:hypothetical protein